MKDARPEYPGADERINVLSFSAINGGDRSDTSQSVYKVYRRLVHRLCETGESAFSAEGRTNRGKPPRWKREKKNVPIVPSLIEHLSNVKRDGAPL